MGENEVINDIMVSARLGHFRHVRQALGIVPGGTPGSSGRVLPPPGRAS